MCQMETRLAHAWRNGLLTVGAEPAVVDVGEYFISFPQFFCQIDIRVARFDACRQRVEPFEMLAEALDSIFSRLSGGDEEGPVGTLQQQRLTRGLIEHCERVF